MHEPASPSPSSPSGRPPASDALARLGRDDWEVPAALATMLVVLTALDLAWLRQPELLLSFAPLLLLIGAAFVHVRLPEVLGSAALCLGLAAVRDDARFAGLGYPVVALAAVLALRGWRAR